MGCHNLWNIPENILSHDTKKNHLDIKVDVSFRSSFFISGIYVSVPWNITYIALFPVTAEKDLRD